jgi:gliding motility-associated-like protein
MMQDNSDAFRGKLDEVMVFDRALDTLQFQQLDVYTPRVRWSTGDTTKSITVSPDSTTLYHVTVTNGVSSCTDSIRVGVVTIEEYDPLPDNLSVCGDSVILDAGAGYERYKWNTGDTVSSKSVLRSGYYAVEVSNDQGCKAADTTLVFLMKAKILNEDTLICKDEKVVLRRDSTNERCITFLGEYNGHYYYSSCENTFSWTQSMQFAGSLSPFSSLAIINDAAENAFLSGVTNGIWMWIGLKQDLTDPGYNEPRGAWKWLDGSVAIFQNWGPGEPNNGNGLEHYGCFNNASGVTIRGGWNDGMDIYQFAALIESSQPLPQLNFSTHWSTGDTTPSITVTPDTTTTYYVTVSNGITSCTDSVMVTVSAIRDFNPFPDSLFVCADSIVLDAGTGYSSYDWNTGDTTQRITVFRKGWHKVIVTNESGCRAEDSIYIRRVFADILQNDTSLRALTPYELSIDTSYFTENGYKVYWSTGDSTTSITVVPRQKTKYYVRVTDGVVTCTDSITIDVKRIGGFNPCPPKVAKCDRRVVLDAGPGYLSYLWSTGDTTQQITVTSNGYYTVYVFDSSGAFGEDSTYVNLLALTLQPRDTTICRGSSVQLTAGNFFNGNDLILPTFAWATGEQDTALNVSPGETTTYYAKLTNANNSCRDSAIVRVVAVDASLSIVGDSVLCANSNDSIVLRAGRGRSYQWLNNGGAIAGANDSLYVTRQAGNYSVVVTDTLGCQDSSRVQSVVVSPLPVGTFLPPASNSFCIGDSVLLAATGANSYRWYLNGSPINGATAARYYAKQAGTYSVVFVSDKGCIVPGDTIVLRASKKPKASFTYTTYCAGISSQFSSTSDTLNAGDLQYLWKFADGSTAGGPAISHVFARSGNYPVQLILTSFDCPNYADTATVNVNVQAPAAGIRYRTLNLTINVSVTLVARPLGNDFLWTPSNGLDDPRARTPRLMPKENATYLIRISNTAGCVTTDTLGVQVFDGRDLFVARGFTPNNDGKNDRLYPIAIGIVELRYFRIYNRWGNLVFQSSSLLPQDGWDGTYSGKAQTSDTYTWMAEGVDIEGKVIRRSGSSILIR